MQTPKLLIFSVLLLSLAVVVGCGGNSSIASTAQVASISVTCDTCIFPNGATGVEFAPSNQVIMDLTEGQVETLTPTILGLNGQALSGPLYPITYTVDDTSAVSVSPGGEVCAGVWDAQFINCQPGTIPYFSTNDKLYPGPLPAATPTPTPAPGATPGPSPTPYPGPKLTIATTGGGGGTVTITVKVHPVVDTIQLSTTYPNGANCISQNPPTAPAPTPTPGLQFAAKAFSQGTDVTIDIGYFNWLISDGTVGQINTSGLATARNPGVAYVTAAVSAPTGTYSQPYPMVVCPVGNISLAVYSTNSVGGISSMAIGNTASLVATVTDTLGNPITDATLKFSSSQPGVLPFTSSGPQLGNVSAAAAGAFSLVASCTPPTCNNGPTGVIYYPSGPPVTPESLGFGYPVYSNLIQGTVAGTTTTNVYVTGTIVPGGHSNKQLRSFNTINLSLVNVVDLPYIPNSLVFDPQGETAYIGTDDTTTGATLMELSPGSTNVGVFTGKVVGNVNVTTVTGTVLAVSPDGTTIIVSDLVNGYLFVVSKVLDSAQFYNYQGVTSATFSVDGSTAFLSGSSGVFSLSTNQEILQPVVTSGTNLNSNTSYLPNGLATIVSNVSGDETAYATCNDLAAATPVVTNAGLITTAQPTGNPRVIGAATDGASWIDTAVTVTAPVVVNPCTPTVTLSPTVVNAALDTCSPAQGPTQLTALDNGTVVFATGVNPTQCSAVPAIPFYNLTTSTAGSITLSAAGIPLSGSATLDNNTLFVGTATGLTANDTGSLHLLNLAGGANTDTLQISLPFIPNLVAVQP